MNMLIVISEHGHFVAKGDAAVIRKQYKGFVEQIDKFHLYPKRSNRTLAVYRFGDKGMLVAGYARAKEL